MIVLQSPRPFDYASRKGCILLVSLGGISCIGVCRVKGALPEPLPIGTLPAYYITLDDGNIQLGVLWILLKYYSHSLQAMR